MIKWFWEMFEFVWPIFLVLCLAGIAVLLAASLFVLTY